MRVLPLFFIPPPNSPRPVMPWTEVQTLAVPVALVGSILHDCSAEHKRRVIVIRRNMDRQGMVWACPIGGLGRP